MLEFLLERAQLLDPLAMVLVLAVAEVQPEDIGARFEQGPQAFRGRRGGAERGDDLGKSIAAHEDSLLRG